MDGAAARNLSESQDGLSASEEVTTGHAAAGQADDAGLSRRELDILAFERQWWKYAGAKEEAIRELFAMSPTRYYQVLNAVVDRPEALAADPMLVKRLRRLRASRQKARAARRLGFQV
ncbi:MULTISPECIES: DUF3263 domain-containing protein [Nocardia]|uniref:DUF3263 domain-containing protein n=1 Tax=Nocardia sputorum TaxID=2984338 RepID=A0ABN6UCI8_9NOCA|nr:DUF3263 domain-containing protein [Nocardia sputorum]BDT93758.1 hypothetical protein IFM12275_37340 [Nocardia sputorum]BDU02906.1 hypothetical protein IFM12276_59340 [Nocardia sputorum]